MDKWNSVAKISHLDSGLGLLYKTYTEGLLYKTYTEGLLYKTYTEGLLYKTYSRVF